MPKAHRNVHHSMEYLVYQLVKIGVVTFNPEKGGYEYVPQIT